MELINNFRNFVKESYFELQKVSWLSRKEVIGSTIVIIILILIVSFFVGLIDLGVSSLLGVFLRR